jgi:hypothetical protein
LFLPVVENPGTAAGRKRYFFRKTILLLGDAVAGIL